MGCGVYSPLLHSRSEAPARGPGKRLGLLHPRLDPERASLHADHDEFLARLDVVVRDGASLRVAELHTALPCREVRERPDPAPDEGVGGLVQAHRSLLAHARLDHEVPEHEQRGRQ